MMYIDRKKYRFIKFAYEKFRVAVETNDFAIIAAVNKLQCKAQSIVQVKL